MSFKLPIKFANGTTIGPVALVCFTIAFIAIIGSFILLVFYAPEERVAYFVRPLVPALAAIGSAALLWWKTHTAQVKTTQQNQSLADQAQLNANLAATAASKVDEVSGKADEIEHALNGNMDAKIVNAVTKVLTDNNLITPPVPVVTTPPPAPVKRAARKRTTKKAS